MAQQGNGTIQSVQRALALLSLFTPAKPVWAVGDLARATGLHKSVVTRLMATMARQGFVVQDTVTRAYSVGPQAFAVGSVYEPYHVLHQVTRPLMDELTLRSGHSTCLGVPAGQRFMIVDTLEGNNQLRVAFEIGERPHYHSAAIGKVLLAGMTDEQVCEIVGDDSFPAITKHSITELDALRAELTRIRASGYALSDQESIIGVGAVAAPLTNAHGSTVAGISVVYPSHLTPETEIEALIELIKEYAVRASERIGVLALPQHISQMPRPRRDATGHMSPHSYRSSFRPETGY